MRLVFFYSPFPIFVPLSTAATLMLLPDIKTAASDARAGTKKSSGVFGKQLSDVLSSAVRSKTQIARTST
jgi:hypothetical protein